MKNYKALQNGSDIRGIATEGIEGQLINLTKEASEDLSSGFALWLAQKTEKKLSELTIAVGRDSRISGCFILKTVSDALSARGVTVLDCGMATTPAMFMATVFEETHADGSIMITASHLPFNRNGFKFFYKKGGLDSKDIAAVIVNAETSDLVVPAMEEANFPQVKKFPLIDRYSEHLRSVITEGLKGFKFKKPLTGLHIVCDAGNGAGGFFVREVLEPLGANVCGSQFLDPDGYFPNHEPNPENKEAMESICLAVSSVHADLGLIFDTDVDRCAAVDSQGRDISRNRIVALAAALVAENYPGSTVVTDSITSEQLTDFLENNLKLSHMRYRRGYRNVINKAIELNEEGIDCHLAIETSGHAAIKENFFLDDGAYLATQIVICAAKLKAASHRIEDVISELKDAKEAVEYRIPILADDFSEYAESVINELKVWVDLGECTNQNPCNGRCRCGMHLVLPNYEGVRISCDKQNGDGWFLLRKSLHEPLLPLNIESNSEGGCGIILEKVKKLLEGYAKLDLSVLGRK